MISPSAMAATTVVPMPRSLASLRIASSTRVFAMRTAAIRRFVDRLYCSSYACGQVPSSSFVCRMNSEIASTAMRDAISPAACPPIPSATRNNRAVLSTRNESSLCCRCRPTCVTPYAFTSTRSALPNLSLPQLGQSVLDLSVVTVPLQRLFEIALGFCRQTGLLADESSLFQILRVHRFLLHHGLDRLDGL